MTAATRRPPTDPERLEALVSRMHGDFGAASVVPPARIGDWLELYRALAEAGPVLSSELAACTRTVERYVRAPSARLDESLEQRAGLHREDLFVSLVEMPRENRSFCKGAAQHAA